jgi:hypothetical protein
VGVRPVTDALMMVTDALAPLVVDHERHTAVTVYVYVPSGTEVSVQLVAEPESSEVGELLHALLGVEPR